MKILPPSFSPIARPIVTIDGVFSGNSPARARMPSVPNNFVLLIISVNVRGASPSMLDFPAHFDADAHGGRMLQADLRVRHIQIDGLLDMSLPAIEPNGNRRNRFERVDTALRSFDFNLVGIHHH